jgi:hypothetical protein
MGVVGTRKHASVPTQQQEIEFFDWVFDGQILRVQCFASQTGQSVRFYSCSFETSHLKRSVSRMTAKTLISSLPRWRSEIEMRVLLQFWFLSKSLRKYFTTRYLNSYVSEVTKNKWSSFDQVKMYTYD